MFRNMFNSFSRMIDIVGNMMQPSIVDDLVPKNTRGKGGRKFTTEATGAAALQRAAKKRNNIRKRSKK